MLQVVPKAHLESGQLGDKDMLRTSLKKIWSSLRIFEAVSSTGMMKDLSED